jgi:hypothetical protein
MTTASATISVNRAGRNQLLLRASDPVREVSMLLQAEAHASDLTISIQLSDDRGLLLVALEAGSAFVGLEASGGIYQYVADENAPGTEQFVIGGQSTAIDRRYVLAIPEAIELLTTCLAGPDPLAATTLERQ